MEAVISKKRDIQTQADILKVITAFYEKARKNSSIGHYFLNVNWEAHLPLMAQFWSFIVLNTDQYRGNPMVKHQHMTDLTNEHFDIWLKLFTQAVDESFSGEIAESMKKNANQIGQIFRIKLVSK